MFVIAIAFKNTWLRMG